MNIQIAPSARVIFTEFIPASLAKKHSLRDGAQLELTASRIESVSADFDVSLRPAQSGMTALIAIKRA